MQVIYRHFLFITLLIAAPIQGHPLRSITTDPGRIRDTMGWDLPILQRSIQGGGIYYYFGTLDDWHLFAWSLETNTGNEISRGWGRMKIQSSELHIDKVFDLKSKTENEAKNASRRLISISGNPARAHLGPSLGESIGEVTIEILESDVVQSETSK